MTHVGHHNRSGQRITHAVPASLQARPDYPRVAADVVELGGAHILVATPGSAW